jgi:hypothetical protein
MIKSLINDAPFVLLGKIVTVEICVAAFPVFGNQTYANLPLESLSTFLLFVSTQSCCLKLTSLLTGTTVNSFASFKIVFTESAICLPAVLAKKNTDFFLC